ncbi:MAG: DHH family phosphoesterase [Candidatus Sungiibacteriota bacterium]
MANEPAQFERVLEIVSSSSKILLATHENPDGDGLAAMLAFDLWLISLGKDATLLVKEELPSYLKFLPALDLIYKEIPGYEYDLLVGFDYGDFKRLGLDEWLAGQTKVKILTFDHHPEGRQKGDIQIIDEKAASTTVLIYRLLQAAHAEITPQIATCILTGIVIDTGGFEHSNANAEALKIAGEMMRRGANLARITRASFHKKDPRLIGLWGEALLRIRVDPVSRLALSRISAEDLQKYRAEREAMVEFSGVLNTIEGARCAAFLSQEPEEPNFIKGSLRSEEYKGVDVSEIAAGLGGGGHKLASGFKIEGQWRDVIEKLIREARKIAREN